MDYEQTNGAAQLGPDDGIETSRSEAYRLLFGENGLDFRALVLSDPVPVGRQILETAGIRAVENWALIALLPSGAIVNRRPKRTPYRRAKGTPFVKQRDGYGGRTVRAGCGVGRA